MADDLEVFAVDLDVQQRVGGGGMHGHAVAGDGVVQDEIEWLMAR